MHTVDAPMLHTIQQAIQLAGVSRRTLYNHSDAGLISYSVGPDGRRRYETAELERMYGSLAPVAHSPAQPNAQVFTQPSAVNDDHLTAMIEAAVERATAPLVAELAELKAVLMRIEHKPQDLPAPQPKRHALKPTSFADLIVFDDDQKQE